MIEMSQPEQPRHESPFKRQLLDGLAKMGETANPALRLAVAQALV